MTVANDPLIGASVTPGGSDEFIGASVDAPSASTPAPAPRAPATRPTPAPSKFFRDSAGKHYEARQDGLRELWWDENNYGALPPVSQPPENLTELPADPRPRWIQADSQRSTPVAPEPQPQQSDPFIGAHIDPPAELQQKMKAIQDRNPVVSETHYQSQLNGEPVTYVIDRRKNAAYQVLPSGHRYPVQLTENGQKIHDITHPDVYGGGVFQKLFPPDKVDVSGMQKKDIYGEPDLTPDEQETVKQWNAFGKPPPEPAKGGYITALKRGVGKAAAGLATTADYLLTPKDVAGDPLFDSDPSKAPVAPIVKWGQGLAKNNPSEFQGGMTENYNWAHPSYWLESLTETAPGLATDIAAAYFTKGRAAKTLVFTSSMAARQYGETYNELVDSGANPNDARANALVSTEIASAVNLLPFSHFFIDNPAAKSALRSAVTQRLLNAGKSAAEVGVASIVTDAAVDTYRRFNGDEDAYKDWFKRYSEAGAHGALLGGIMGATHPVQKPKAGTPEDIINQARQLAGQEPAPMTVREATPAENAQSEQQPQAEKPPKPAITPQMLREKATELKNSGTQADLDISVRLHELANKLEKESGRHPEPSQFGGYPEEQPPSEEANNAIVQKQGTAGKVQDRPPATEVRPGLREAEGQTPPVREGQSVAQETHGPAQGKPGGGEDAGLLKEPPPLPKINHPADLSPESRAHAEKFSSDLLPVDASGKRDMARQAEVDKAYDAQPESKGGKILNADTARELSPNYNNREDRLANTEWTGAPAAAYVKDRFDRKIAEMKAAGKKPDVLFLAGGAASGKSTSQETAALHDVIFDSNINRPEQAREMIDRVLDAGGKVGISYVHRPYENAVLGMLHRANDIGRYVSLHDRPRNLMDLHLKAQKTLEGLVSQYKNNPDVRFRLIDNSRGKDNPTIGDVKDVIEKTGRFRYNNPQELKDAQQRAIQQYTTEGGKPDVLGRAHGRNGPQAGGSDQKLEPPHQPAPQQTPQDVRSVQARGGGRGGQPEAATGGPGADDGRSITPEFRAKTIAGIREGIKPFRGVQLHDDGENLSVTLPSGKKLKWVLHNKNSLDLTEGDTPAYLQSAREANKGQWFEYRGRDYKLPETSEEWNKLPDRERAVILDKFRIHGQYDHVAGEIHTTYHPHKDSTVAGEEVFHALARELKGADRNTYNKMLTVSKNGKPLYPNEDAAYRAFLEYKGRAAYFDRIKKGTAHLTPGQHASNRSLSPKERAERDLMTAGPSDGLLMSDHDFETFKNDAGGLHPDVLDTHYLRDKDGKKKLRADVKTPTGTWRDYALDAEGNKLRPMVDEDGFSNMTADMGPAQADRYQQRIIDELLMTKQDKLEMLARHYDNPNAHPDLQRAAAIILGKEPPKFAEPVDEEPAPFAVRRHDENQYSMLGREGETVGGSGKLFGEPERDVGGEHEKSSGHLLTKDGFEYFEREGNVYRAPLSNSVMPDGYRAGRFESTKSMWARHPENVGSTSREDVAAMKRYNISPQEMQAALAYDSRKTTTPEFASGVRDYLAGKPRPDLIRGMRQAEYGEAKRGFSAAREGASPLTRQTRESAPADYLRQESADQKIDEKHGDNPDQQRMFAVRKNEEDARQLRLMGDAERETVGNTGRLFYRTGEPKPEAVAQEAVKHPATPDNPESLADKQVAASAAGGIQDFGEKIGGARKDVAKPLGPRGGETGKQEDTRPVWRRKFHVLQDVKTKQWSIGYVDGHLATRKTWATEAGAEKALPLLAVSQKHDVAVVRRAAASPEELALPKPDGTAEGSREYNAKLQEIRKRAGGDEWGIFRKIGDRKRPFVKGGFASRDEAIKYMTEHPAEIMEHKFAFPERPWLDRINREGPTVRTGDVSPKQFQDAFNFRGGEFGNWNMGGDGQAALNHAYDALHDLARTLGVPPQALSLDGKLAIAFGARGTGGEGAAAAHYERDYGVMNLTKIRGAGSLAHEWFHAVDHYFARLDGKTPAEMKDGKFQVTSRDDDYLSHGYSIKSKMRPELLDAFKNAIRSMTAKTEDVAIDKTKADTGVERAGSSLKDTIESLKTQMQRDMSHYNKRWKKPTPEQLKQWDELSEKLMTGDVGEGKWITSDRSKYGARQSYQPIEDLNAIYKKVTGRSFATMDTNSDARRIFFNVQNLIQARERVAKASEGASESRKSSTDYFRNSRDIDNFRASDYWSTPHEMGARAFEAYVMDKMRDEGNQSQYLVHAAENKYYALMGFKPYPEGAERTIINKAFDDMFKAVKVDDTGKMFAVRPTDESELSPPPEEPEKPENADTRPPATLFGQYDQSPTSIKNAHTDEMRQNLGLPEAEPVMRRSYGEEVMRDARAKLKDNPAAADELVEKLKANSATPITDTEAALLTMRQVDLQTQHAKVASNLIKAHEDNDPAAIVENRAREAALSDKLLEHYNVDRAAGTASARGLAARRMMMNEDYSLAAMETRKRAVNDGRRLTPEESAHIKELHAKLADVQQKFDDYVNNAEEKLRQAKSKAASDRAVRDAGGMSPMRGKARVERAKNGIRQLVASLKEASGTPFAVRGDGEGEQPEQPPERPIDWSQVKELPNALRELERGALEQGITDREKRLDFVHKEAQDAGLAGISRREVMDALSGYGKFKQLSKEDIDVRLRQGHQEMQQVSKIEDLQKGLAPKKTGMERQEQTDEARRLSQQVNDLKKKLGIQTTDPATQLKSALDATKTRLRNQIKDLEYQIATKQRMERTTKPGPTDAEADALRKQRDDLQTQFDNTFGKRGLSDEQRAKIAADAIQKQIADLERRIKEKDVFAGKPGSSTPNTPELGALRARREALKEEFALLRDTNPAFQAAESDRANAGTIKRLQDVIDKNTKRIADGDVLAKTKAPSAPDTPEIAALKAQNDRLNKTIRDLRNQQTPRKTPDEIALQAFKTRTRMRMAELAERLVRRDFGPSEPKAELKLDPEAQRLRADKERMQTAFDMELERDRLKKRTPAEKFQDTITRWSRAFVLSYPSVIKKLGAAALARVVTTPIEEAAGAGIGKLVPGLSARAPREGGGFNVKAEAKALTDMVVKGAPEAWKKLKTGRSDIDYLYGNKKENAVPDSWIDFFGHLHGAMKEPVRQAEFARSFQKRVEHAMRKGEDVTNPVNQMKYGVAAYEDANRAIFMQKNWLADKVNGFIAARAEAGEQHPGAGQKVFETAGKLAVPITKVPTNIVAETLNYALGLELGTARAAKAYFKGIDKLPPEQADSIMRSLKKGSIGSALLLLGFYGAGAVGGMYQKGQKRDEADVPEDEVRILGFDIPKDYLHNPLLKTLQIGATVRRVADSKMRRSDDDTQGVPAGVLASALGLIEDIPFAKETIEISSLFDPAKRQGVLDRTIAGRIVPGIIAQPAKYFDTNENGEPVQRKPRGIVQTIESNIPGLRRNVPQAGEGDIDHMDAQQAAKVYSGSTKDVRDKVHDKVRDKITNSKSSDVLDAHDAITSRVKANQPVPPADLARLEAALTANHARQDRLMSDHGITPPADLDVDREHAILAARAGADRHKDELITALTGRINNAYRDHKETEQARLKQQRKTLIDMPDLLTGPDKDRLDDLEQYRRNRALIEKQLKDQNITPEAAERMLEMRRKNLLSPKVLTKAG